MSILRRLSDSSDPESLANRFRAKRFQIFLDLVGSIPRPISLVDVGGTVAFWTQRGLANCSWLQITVVNLHAQTSPHSNIRATVGDAMALDFEDGQFDIAFSNSVIEHLFTLDNQISMAREVQRVAHSYWVQTPNYWFPMEPHFQVPGWQWMPERLRIGMIRRYRCGWRGPCPEASIAARLVREVRLMTKDELLKCFPDSRLISERFFGLVKSWIVIGGFE
jgi:hypothetical protein